MFTVVTIKIQAETEEERLHTLSSQFEATRNHFEECKKEGFFGPQELVEMRYLVDTVKLHPGPQATQATPETIEPAGTRVELE